MQRGLARHIGFWAAAFFFVAASASVADEGAVEVSVSQPGATVEIARLLEEGKLLVRVVDQEKRAVLGLGMDEFSVRQGGITAQIISVQTLAESKEVPRHICLVLDNSYSMVERKAVEPLLAGVGELLETIRPIDEVHIVVFDMERTVKMGGRRLHVETFTSKSPQELKEFVTKAYSRITYQTVLYEAMLAGLDLINRMPQTEPRFLVIFSDGEDQSSAYSRKDVTKVAQGIGSFNAYAIDFMPRPEKDKFLADFSSENRGEIWKAEAAANLIPIFQSVAATMQYYYVISYLLPPSVYPQEITIEEIKTIDSSPMLAHIYFAPAQSEMPDKYIRLTPEQTNEFDPQKLRGTMEKYYHLLNIIGKRMVEHQEATINLVGCNDNTLMERGNKGLSSRRAEAIRDYLHSVWKIPVERMAIEARNLPQMPSATHLKEGQEENRRAEIHSAHPAILSPIPSIYLETQIDAEVLLVQTNVGKRRDIVRWKIIAANTSGMIAALSGDGPPAAEVSIPLPKDELAAMAAGGDIAVEMQLEGKGGNIITLSAGRVKINYIQRSKRLAQRQQLKVQEKYALILFDFDKDTIDARNGEIIKQIASRIRELPQAKAVIVGHTDNIGSEKYNMGLSERRALAVYKMLAAATGEASVKRISHKGVGPRDPLYDNQLAEGRAFNRTVTITLEYEVME